MLLLQLLWRGLFLLLLLPLPFWLPVSHWSLRRLEVFILLRFPLLLVLEPAFVPIGALPSQEVAANVRNWLLAAGCRVLLLRLLLQVLMLLLFVGR